MKISWGTGIVLAFIGFIGFILYFVIIASTSERANHDLVTERYYEQELDFQNEIDAERNASNLEEQIGIISTGEGILLQFPKSLQVQGSKGTISLYRPSNKKLDFEMPLAISNSEMHIPGDHLLEGKWIISVRWETNGRAYLQKEDITFIPNKGGYNK